MTNVSSSMGSIEVVQEGVKRIERIESFDTAGLHPAMVQNVKLCGWDNPTPIQKYTIPSIVQGHDVIGIAQTGKCFTYRSSKHLYADSDSLRLWEDWCLLDPHFEQVDGKSSTACGSSTKPLHLPPR